MPDTVPVTLDVDPETAAALEDPATRTRIERPIRRVVQPVIVHRLFETIGAFKADAHRRGLTDEIVDEELAAYNAERRDASSAV